MVKASAHWQNLQHNFGNVDGKIITGDFLGGELTDLGGLIGLAPLIKGSKIFKSFASNLVEWRSGTIDYTLEHLIAQRVGLILAGYEDGNDSNFKRNDKGLQTFLQFITGVSKVASQGTISLFEGRTKVSTNLNLQLWFIKTYVQDLKKRLGKLRLKRKQVILDLDGASSPVSGNQQGSAYHGHYEVTMYRPIFAIDGESNLVVPYLRPGNASELWQVLELLSEIIGQLRSEIPGIVITIRCDAGFNDPKIYDWCEDNNVFYILRLKGTGENGSLWTESKPSVLTAEKQFKRRFKAPRYQRSKISKTKLETEIKRLNREKRTEKLAELQHRIVRVFSEFKYEAGKGGQDGRKWRQPRRTLCVVTYSDWGPQKAFFVTNITDGNCEQLVHGLYNRRGNMERSIEELKRLHCTRLSCQSFEANQFRLYMHGLAYRIMTMIRRLLPANIRSWSMNSMRKRLINMPALITQNLREISFHWPSSCLWKKEFHQIFRRTSSA